MYFIDTGVIEAGTAERLAKWTRATWTSAKLTAITHMSGVSVVDVGNR